MPKYMILSRTFVHAKGAADIGVHEPGAVIECDDAPGVSMFPLDAKAWAARKRVLAKRNPRQRDVDALQVKKFRRGLTPSLNRILDAAQAELEADHG